MSVAAPGHWDECRARVGASPEAALQPEWSRFFAHLGPEMASELDQRFLDLQREVYDNGITYNVYADAERPQRPWSVDLFPLIVPANEWPTLEAGLKQRAQLLERIMADAYGEQRLLREALIPPALVHGHPGFIASLRGVNSNPQRALHIVAFDLAHGPDGHWWVVSQRTQAPSGLGYLLENRALISRLFPSAFQDLQVQRLGNTYQRLMDGIRANSPAGGSAHVVLLTPGPYNETYFEHAYLARHLGIPLVEGSDLTVRQQRVYLNTLHGLEPVHAIIKRLDDEFLDPLELRSDSTLGIPGLLQAIRAGHVLVANAPGSAFLESPALLGFLPGLSEALLGESLSLPSLPTWWCGERAALDQAQQRLGSSVIKPTFPAHSPNALKDAVLGKTLHRREQDEWAGRIARQGDDYTVQSYIPLSQMPIWLPREAVGHAAWPACGRIDHRSVLLRVFAVADAAGGWHVLPGGLARITVPGMDIASMQRGGSSADVWVLGQPGMAEEQTTYSVTGLTAAQVTTSRKLLVTGRAAENLYWLGRYTERCENTVSLARLVMESLQADHTPSNLQLQWLHRLCTRFGLVPEEVPHPTMAPRVFERTLMAHLTQTKWSTSVGFNLQAMKKAASSVRERISTEHWNLIDRTTIEFFDQARPLTPWGDSASVEMIQRLNTTHRQLAAITGAQTDRMVRDDGWRLLSIGRLLERLYFLSTALSIALDNGALAPTAPDEAVHSALLKLFDSTTTYQAHYQHYRGLDALLALLVHDGDNPRALTYVSKTLRGRLARLAGRERHELDELALQVPEPETWGDHLAPALTQSLPSILQLSEAIGARYFTHADDVGHASDA